MSDLKSCPFCGIPGENLEWRTRSGSIELVEHPNTDCVMSDVRTEDVDAWNTRHYPPEVQALIAAAKEYTIGYRSKGDDCEDAIYNAVKAHEEVE